jgi:hypothetical protein
VVLCRLQLDLDAAALREGEGLLVGRRAVVGGAERDWWQHEEEEEEAGDVSISKTATKPMEESRLTNVLRVEVLGQQVGKQ